MKSLSVWWCLTLAILSVSGSTLYYFAKGETSPVLKPVNASLIVKPGTKVNGWMLVEFGDFECPACRRVAPELERFLVESPQKVTFQFRHMVLRRHKLAAKAAAICEVARTSNRFDECRDFFFDADRIDAATLTQAEKLFTKGVTQVELGRAYARVGLDNGAGARLKIDGIPALFMVNPEGKAYRVKSLAEAYSVMRSP